MRLMISPRQSRDGRTTVLAARRRAIVLCAGALLAVGLPVGAAAQPADADGDWPMYRGNLAGTGYSPLTAIAPDNVAGLVRAWTYDLNRAAPDPSGRGPNSQATPIVVDGVMYLPAADRVVALRPETGEELWSHPVDGRPPSRRGVAWWPGDDEHEPRILFTTGLRLHALDAATGEPAAGFGDIGSVGLGIPYNSVPLVYRHVVVVGANTPPGTIGGIGNARAYDVRTGARLWEFDSVAQPGDVGHDTWAGDSWQGRLGANAWPFFFTADAERGLVYLPLASPIPGYYGGDRPGANLYGNSLVAVEAETGEYVWHFQTIHHDLWDADPPAPPALFDIPHEDGAIPALGVTTKSGYLYILNRETGEPIHGVEEREVAASDVPGEAAYPTQPIPVKPPPMGRVRYEASDLVTAEDTTPEHAAACAALVDSLGEIHNAGPFTPGSTAPPAPRRGPRSIFRAASAARTGAASRSIRRPATPSSSRWTWAPSAGWSTPRPTMRCRPYEKQTPRPAGFEVSLDGVRLPCQKPPWGQLTAVDVATGDIAWRETLGVTDTLPADKRNTGRPGRAAAIATAGGLLFIAATDDNRFRAIEAATGRELWADRLDQRGNADPMTYLGADGRQYVVIAATDAIVAYALP